VIGPSKNQSSRGHENQDIISSETPRINPGRPSARTGGKGSGAVDVLFIGFFDGKEIVQQEIAIHDLPIRSEPFVYTGQVSEIGRKSQIGKSKFPRSWNARNRKSRSAISRRDQHRPSARTRGERSQKVGVRHIGNRRIGDFKDMKPLHHKTAI
jgi:hypothetical protein